MLAERGQRVWEPSPEMPALIILIDEYAELVDEAPEAVKDADSVARRGRAVVVNLIAATQRPTQKAMGQGAVRSQMDVRVCFRVRERKDVDLILGQGMLAAGWNAHALNAPGKFLISAAEHDTPRRARAYLISDQAVANTARWYADLRRPLDPVRPPRSAHPLEGGPQIPMMARTGPIRRAGAAADAAQDPDALLWAALSIAPEPGVPVADLVAATGRSHRWVQLPAPRSRRKRPGDPGQARNVAHSQPRK